MQSIALLLCGFSVFYVVVFITTHFTNEYYHTQKIARIFGVALMLAMAVLQLFHFAYLQTDSTSLNTPAYLVFLYMVAPSFYFYARPVLKAEDGFSVINLLHFVPIIAIFVLPYHWAFTLAFIIGSVYLLWLLKTIYALRTHKEQFKNELILLTMVFVIAIGVSAIALSMPFGPKLFYSLYASAIGFALFIVALVVSYKPKLSESLSEAAKETYAVSTLTAIDCEAKLALLDNIMRKDKLYQQSNLDRETLATELDLSTHQLSELINTNLGMGFSQYLRKQRIDTAKKLLLSQPKASVLSIGLEVGFSSQSNFYQAFKDLVGTTPAKYRNI
jgi:AraC-like DNA-binding protein